MKEFKVNKSKFIKELIPSLIIMAIFIGMIAYFMVKCSDNRAMMLFVAIIFVPLICYVSIYPTYCLISQYKYEQDVTFSIDEQTKECIYTKGKKYLKFNIDDIKYVYLHSLPIGMINISSTGEYTEIMLKTGKFIYLSSFLIEAYYFTGYKKQIVYENTFNMAFPLDTQEYWAVGIKNSDVA